MLSSIILKIMHEHATKANFHDPLVPKRTVQIANTAFVDDTSGYQNQTEDTSTKENIDQLILNLKNDVTTWDRLLYATGGLLELQKCFFYLTIWKFRKDGSTRTLTPEEIGVQLNIDRPDGTSVAITQKAATEPHKLLGILRSPTGDQHPEAAAINKKCDKFARALNASGLNRADVQTAYFSNFIPSVSYSLNLTSIEPKTLRQAQTKPKNCILDWIGIQQKHAVSRSLRIKTIRRNRAHRFSRQTRNIRLHNIAPLHQHQQTKSNCRSCTNRSQHYTARSRHCRSSTSRHKAPQLPQTWMDPIN